MLLRLLTSPLSYFTFIFLRFLTSPLSHFFSFILLFSYFSSCLLHLFLTSFLSYFFLFLNSHFNYFLSSLFSFFFIFFNSFLSMFIPYVSLSPWDYFSLFLFFLQPFLLFSLLYHILVPLRRLSLLRLPYSFSSFFLFPNSSPFSAGQIISSNPHTPLFYPHHTTEPYRLFTPFSYTGH